MLIDFGEWGREEETEGEKRRWLPLARAPTGDQTRRLSVYGTVFRPTEHHWPGHEIKH